jgi:hypothetical protein
MELDSHQARRNAKVSVKFGVPGFDASRLSEATFVKQVRHDPE